MPRKNLQSLSNEQLQSLPKRKTSHHHQFILNRKLRDNSKDDTDNKTTVMPRLRIGHRLARLRKISTSYRSSDLPEREEEGQTPAETPLTPINHNLHRQRAFKTAKRVSPAPSQRRRSLQGEVFQSGHSEARHRSKTSLEIDDEEAAENEEWRLESSFTSDRYPGARFQEPPVASRIATNSVPPKPVDQRALKRWELEFGHMSTKDQTDGNKTGNALVEDYLPHPTVSPASSRQTYVPFLDPEWDFASVPNGSDSSAQFWNQWSSAEQTRAQFEAQLEEGNHHNWQEMPGNKSQSDVGTSLTAEGSGAKEPPQKLAHPADPLRLRPPSQHVSFLTPPIGERPGTAREDLSATTSMAADAQARTPTGPPVRRRRRRIRFPLDDSSPPMSLDGEQFDPTVNTAASSTAACMNPADVHRREEVQFTDFVDENGYVRTATQATPPTAASSGLASQSTASQDTSAGDASNRFLGGRRLFNRFLKKKGKDADSTANQVSYDGVVESPASIAWRSSRYER
ncbi:hypothetical protein QFC21_005005 [Naganishia friedmannii]|uniref:Uncharacterized protein n=1 Tax=Naganishia friedmannii TaxID=89922 RepID=A0ACC2VCT4_9TREE|nr:hypothetical protein QFC21_005005 [Naganishia friedmannii]